MSSNPYSFMKLVGSWNVVGVPVAMPIDDVRVMLPEQMQLGPHGVTPAGTHPVLFVFAYQYAAHMTFPRYFPPDMTYYEQAVVVPYAERLGGGPIGPYPGPFWFFPRLNLSEFLPTFGGWLIWGLAKTLARIAWTAGKETNQGVYAVSPLTGGAPIITLEYTVPHGAVYRPVDDVPYAAQIRQMNDQPFAGLPPSGMGPTLASANLAKTWDRSVIRGVEAEVLIQSPFVLGLEIARYRAKPLSASDPLGAYQLRGPWTLTLPYFGGDGLDLLGDAEPRAARRRRHMR